MTTRIPEPALVRSTLVAVTGIVALIVGHTIDTSWIEAIVTTYAALSPILAGILIRRVVTPVASLGSQAPE